MAGRIKSTKNPNETNGNRTRVLPTYSEMMNKVIINKYIYKKDKA